MGAPSWLQCLWFLLLSCEPCSILERAWSSLKDESWPWNWAKIDCSLSHVIPNSYPCDLDLAVGMRSPEVSRALLARRPFALASRLACLIRLSISLPHAAHTALIDCANVITGSKRVWGCSIYPPAGNEMVSMEPRERGAPLPLLRGRRSGAALLARRPTDGWTAKKTYAAERRPTPIPPAQLQISHESAYSWIVAPTHHAAALGLTRVCSASTAVPSSWPLPSTTLGHSEVLNMQAIGGRGCV